MGALPQSHLRLVYSLLKPAVRAAARFHVPIRTLSELLRLAYFEVLRHEGLSQAQIAGRLGQTDRHMRSLAKRFKTDFFAAEQEVGLVREVETVVATEHPLVETLSAHVRAYEASDVAKALETLIAEERVQIDAAGKLAVSPKYVLLASDQFHHRIDALNHFLDGVYRAVLARLVFDDREQAMIKTISFTAIPARFKTFLQLMEGDLRQRIADLEEQSSFSGEEDQRYTLGITASPHLSDGGV